ncbi:MAG: class I SAM-dependent methyltransferase [Pirellulaceae bacterium]|nr:class I SAM-dependent methyltransferase [Pirellulaceae bacterium]MDP7304504.1 class I SAM-dependent methyltransferase [Pirellulaceae bacterium]HJN10876.1 class I SAM-dependent methyltransferase [Pirellulaceae bacterium]
MTLKRVLEPEVMDTDEESRDYDAMDHATVNQAFVEDLLAGGDVHGEVIDLGTGTAQIPILLCQHVEECRVMAIDLSIAMLDLARLNIEVNSLIDRISLAHIDSKELVYDDDQFDVVMSNSIVHHVPEPVTVIAEAVRVTKPGGRLFFRDLLRPSDDSTVEQLVTTYAAEADARQRKMFDDSLRAALSLDEVRELVAALGFASESVAATSDRHWTWDAVKPPSYR